MKLTKVTWDENSRYLRVGFGKNDGRWFARIDFWWFGYRITR